MPFGADTPTPEFVGNSRVRGARSPPGTPRDLITPSRAHLGPAAGHTDLPADFARAKRRSVARRTSSRESGEAPPARTSPEQSPKVCRPVTFPEQSGKVCPPGLHQSKVGKCARRRFRAAGRCACPGGEKPPARRKKSRVFSRPLRACIRKRGLLFRKKNR